MKINTLWGPPSENCSRFATLATLAKAINNVQRPEINFNWNNIKNLINKNADSGSEMRSWANSDSHSMIAGAIVRNFSQFLHHLRHCNNRARFAHKSRTKKIFEKKVFLREFRWRNHWSHRSPHGLRPQLDIEARREWSVNKLLWFHSIALLSNAESEVYEICLRCLLVALYDVITSIIDSIITIIIVSIQAVSRCLPLSPFARSFGLNLKWSTIGWRF